MKIGVIHAAASAVQPLEQVFHEMAPEAMVDNHLNEDMLKEAEKNGVSPKALRMFAKEVFQAADEGADGIIVACSVFCSSLDVVCPFLSVPVIAVDDPALHIAVQRGGKIGILATTASSAPACAAKLDKIAEETGTVLDYAFGIVPEALTALKNGDGETHDRLLIQKAQELAEQGCTTLFLSQVSMARAKVAMPEELRLITLTTPEEGAAEIMRLIKTEM